MSKQVLTFEVDVPDDYTLLSAGAGDITTHVFDDKSGIVINCMIGIMPVMNIPNPNAALIVKANELKLLSNYWYRCFQYKEHKIGSEWQNWTHNCDFINTDNYDYRLNPHWGKIIEFHQCSDEDKKRWQVSALDNVWIDWDIEKCGIPDFDEFYQYRLRPKVCQVTIDGVVIVSKTIKRLIFLRWIYEREKMARKHPRWWGVVQRKIKRVDC